MRRALPALALLAALGGGAWFALRGGPIDAAGPDPAAGPSPDEPRPNVLIVMWDTVRADRMSVYGHPRPTTPWLERFAEDAVVFEQAVSPGMWTVPSHASLFTGLPVASHGANARWIWLDERFDTMAERLGAAGYDTFAFSSNPYLSPATNLLQGFDTVALSWDGPWSEATAEATERKLVERDRSSEISPSWRPTGHGAGWPEHLTAYKDGGPVLGEALLDWLDERPDDKPWLAFLNYLEAHHPRVPSMDARQALLDEALLEQGLQTDASLFHIMAYMEERHSYSDAELEAIRGVYDATLRDLDAATEALIGALGDRGVLDDTIVVIVSDHGEHLGEHGMFDHRWSVWQELLHVPLIIRYPRGMPPRREAAPVSTQDVFATVLDLAGMPVPAGIPSRSLREAPEGRAFSELVQPTPRLPVVRRAFADLSPDRWRSRYRVVVDGADKLILRSDGHKALFDLASDPGEQDDRSQADPERARALHQVLRDWQRGLDHYDPQQRAATDRPGRALEQPESIRDQLRMLGYVDGEEEP